MGQTNVKSKARYCCSLYFSRLLRLLVLAYPEIIVYSANPIALTIRIDNGFGWLRRIACLLPFVIPFHVPDNLLLVLHGEPFVDAQDRKQPHQHLGVVIGVTRVRVFPEHILQIVVYLLALVLITHTIVV